MKYFLFISLLLTTIVSYSQSLYQKMDSIRRKHHIPEMACAIVSSKGIQELQICGYHRSSKTDAADTAKMTDYFHLGSNTKAITGFIAATLLQKGLIQWNTKFFSLFPEWQKNADPAYKDITLQELLSHRAHIQPFTEGEKDKAPKIKGNRSEQRAAFAKYVLKQPPVYPAKNKEHDYSGSTYIYSNAGYTLASLMLEKAGSATWEQLAINLMNERLHFNIGFGWPNLTDSLQPWGHLEENNKLIELPPNTDYNLSGMEPAGDIKMTLSDYAKFIQLQLLGLKGKDTILDAGTYRFLHFGLKEYAIGWGNVTVKGKEYSEHEGSAGTFHVLTSICATDDIAYIIFINSAGDETNKAKTELFKYLRSTYSPK